jgi:hypothetical protein
MTVKNTTKNGYPVLQKGGLKEEVWEWTDLETVARAGQFSPDSLIFFEDENTWKKAIDTDLADCFATIEPDPATNQSTRDFETEYEDALREIREKPADQGLVLHAAEVALAMDNADAACGHYQLALEMTPFHPRVAQEAKRNLPHAQWKSLRLLEKPPHIWEEPFHLAVYPLKRGPLYMLIPAIAIFALSWSIWTLVPAALLIGLWATEVIAASSGGRAKPPLWHSFVSDPPTTILRRLAVLTGVAMELYLPFVAIAVVLMVTGQSDRANIFEVIARSPVMTVVVFTVSLFYLPAVLTLLSASSTTRIRDALNPLHIASAIRRMEGEYIAALGFILAMIGALWGLGRLLGPIPLAPRVLYAAATVYAVLAGGLVLGRLYSRFREQLEETNDADGADPAQY